jgi:hypothetical protein
MLIFADLLINFQINPEYKFIIYIYGQTQTCIFIYHVSSFVFIKFIPPVKNMKFIFLLIFVIAANKPKPLILIISVIACPYITHHY